MLFAFSYFFFMHFTSSWLLSGALFLSSVPPVSSITFWHFCDTEFSNQQIIVDILYITAIPLSLYHLSRFVCFCHELWALQHLHSNQMLQVRHAYAYLFIYAQTCWQMKSLFIFFPPIFLSLFVFTHPPAVYQLILSPKRVISCAKFH